MQAPIDDPHNARLGSLFEADVVVSVGTKPALEPQRIGGLACAA